MKVCVLIATTHKYLWVAKFTRSMVELYWPDHPDIYFSGVKKYDSSNEWLPFNRDTADWTGALYDATGELIRLGYSAVYLILDDHPPLARCNGIHLNNTIPEMMAEFDAVYIGLNGWGQGRTGRRPNGKIIKDHYWLENTSESFAWKYSLHPALWNLESLKRIAEMVLKENIKEVPSSWIFERYAGAPEAKIPEDWKNQSYRICGYKMAVSFTQKIIRKLELIMCRILISVSTRMFGGAAGKKMENRVNFINQYYEGAYPLFWSGVMQKGKINAELISFLKYRNKRAYLRKLDGAHQ